MPDPYSTILKKLSCGFLINDYFPTKENAEKPANKRIGDALPISSGSSLTPTADREVLHGGWRNEGKGRRFRGTGAARRVGRISLCGGGESEGNATKRAIGDGRGEGGGSGRRMADDLCAVSVVGAARRAGAGGGERRGSVRQWRGGGAGPPLRVALGCAEPVS